MIRTLLIAVLFPFLLLGLMLALSLTPTQKVHAAERGPRFERISDEHHDSNINHAAIFEVWHDTSSGQEFTCVGSRDTNNSGALDGKAWPLSCFPSGRKW